MLKNGDIMTAYLSDKKDGSIQAGTRPVLVVSNNKANEYSPVVTVVPLTAKTKKYIPTHVTITDCGLYEPSVALVEQITSISKENLGKRIGTIHGTCFETLIKKAINIQLDIQGEIL